MNSNIISDVERHNIAGFMRRLSSMNFNFDWQNIASAIGESGDDDARCWMRLANLIEPQNDTTLLEVYSWAFENLESCDEPEYSMYNNILGAIQNYYDLIEE